MRRPLPSNGSSRFAIASLAAGALLVRIPAFVSSRHLGFDDGVYGASARAMRDGALPFRDVFSSQGPLFLPLVWLADLAGFRRANSPRLLAVAAGVGVALATYAVARSAGARWAPAIAAAAIVATSGSMLFVSGPLTSDGVAVALATMTVAVALRYRRRPNLRTAVAIGLLVAATLSVKSLLVGMTVPVAWALLRPNGPRRPAHVTAALGVALAAGFAIAAPFGIARVWDQSVRYHLDAAGSRTLVANARKTTSTALARDLPLVALAAAAGVCAASRRRSVRPPPASVEGATDEFSMIAGWLFATALVLLLEHPLWRNHVAHLLPPLAVLVALRPPPLRVGVAVAALSLPWQFAHLGGVLWPRPYGTPARQAVADIASLPPHTWSISDEPGLVWRAGKRTPGDLVDTSRLRIEEGRITTASLVRAAGDRRVCTLVVWSHRFGNLPGLERVLEQSGFAEGRRYDRLRRLYVKNSCQLP